MATIIDSLLVKLGLDSSEFNAGKAKVDKGLQGTGAEAEKAGNKLKKSGKDGAEGFETVAKSAAKFLAIVGGTVAIKQFATQMIESNAALERFANNIGVSTKALTAWGNAAEIAGGSADGVKSAMDMLGKSQTELMLTGQSNLIPYFSALGVSMTDAYGKALPVNELLMNIGQALLTKTPDRQTAFNMGRMMGIDEGTLNLILRERKEVELLLAQQKEYAETVSKFTPEASKLNRMLVESKQAFTLLGLELLSRAAPAIEKLLSAFTAMGQWMRDNSEFVETFLSILAVGLGAVAASTIPINLTVAAVTGLIAAMALLWQDYQTWKRGGESFIDWSKWEPGFKAAGDGIRWLKDMIEDMVYRAIAAADLLAAVWNRDWKRVKFAAGEFITGTRKTYGERPQETVPPPQTGNKQADAMAYFQAQGWTREQAAGIVANMKQESAFNPAAVGDSGKAYGIMQWHPDRQAEFEKKFGKSIKGSTFEDQLAFIQYELTLGKERAAGERIRQAQTGQQAAAVGSKYYLRPGDVEGEQTKRASIATSILGGVPGASQAAAGAGAGQVAQSNTTNNVAGNRSVETHIGEVKVYSAATDANGIAKDMGKSMDYLFASQANYGLM